MMFMELAIKAGYSSVNKFLASITSSEYSEWVAYNLVESGQYDKYLEESRNAGHVMKERFARFAVKKD